MKAQQKEDQKFKLYQLAQIILENKKEKPA